MINRLLSGNEAMSNVDTAWLRMEEPNNLMMVSGVMTFEKPLDYERLKDILRQRLLKFDRFRQRVVDSRLPMNPPLWETVPELDLENHLYRIKLPSPGDQATLQQVVSELASTQLDYSKPLWEFHLLESYGKGSAVMARFHHCIADGIALIYVLLSLTDPSADAPTITEEPHADKRNLSLLNILYKQTANTLRTVQQVRDKLIHEAFSILGDPSRALKLSKLASDTANATLRLALRNPDPQTIFKGPLEIEKRAAWSQALSLQDVKFIGKATGSTVNDVLLSAVAGGLRRYMEYRGESPDGINFRAAVPVNLRQPEEMGQLGNRFGLVFLLLPIGLNDPLKRLAELKRRMNKLKDSPEAVVTFGILHALGLSAVEIERLVVDFLGAKVTAVMTNVPGPQTPLYFAGQKINDIMFWVPQSGRAGIGVSVLSYAGKVFLGVITDKGLVPDPDNVISGFYQELDALIVIAKKPRCQAITKAGKPCKNRTKADSLYCAVHQRQT